MNIILSDKLDEDIIKIENNEKELYNLNMHDKNDIFFLIFYPNTKYIKICFHHYFCGIFIFHKIISILLDGNVLKGETYSILDDTFSLKKKQFNLMRLVISRSYKLNRNLNYDITKTIRITSKINFDDLSVLLVEESNNIPIKLKITYLLVNLINLSLKEKKELSIMSPIFFVEKKNKKINNENNENNENNVGALFFKYPKEGMKLKDFINYINKLQYQYIATNYYLNNFKDNNAGNRNNLDYIISSGFISDHKYNLENIILTHNIESSTPLYCNILVSSKNIHITFTNNTDDIDNNILLEQLPNSRILNELY